MLIKKDSTYLLHTPLGIWAGRVVEIEIDEVMLDQCSWIAQQGRMGQCVSEGTYEECEFVGDGVIIPRPFIAVPWRHPLPTETK